jgi:hypothetical protein
MRPEEWESTAKLIGGDHEMAELRGLLQMADAAGQSLSHDGVDVFEYGSACGGGSCDAERAVTANVGTENRINSLQSKEKIAQLTSTPSDCLPFEDRAAMLENVRARVSF